MRIAETIKNPGDWQQIKELSRLYNRMLDCKEQLMQGALRAELSSYQIAEVELSLAIITGNLKEVDAKIHYLMFGGELMPNAPAKPLLWNALKLLKGETEFNQPAMLVMDENYKDKRIQHLERRLKNEFRMRCSLHQQIWKMKKQLKTKATNVLVGIPGPLTITVPNKEDFNND